MQSFFQHTNKPLFLLLKVNHNTNVSAENRHVNNKRVKYKVSRVKTQIFMSNINISGTIVQKKVSVMNRHVNNKSIY